MAVHGVFSIAISSPSEEFGRTRARVTRPDGAALTAADANTVLGALQTWEASQSAYMAHSTSMAIESTVDNVDDDTGEITSTVTITDTITPYNSLDTAAFPAGAGICLSWETGVRFRSRAIAGRWFLVPLAGSAYTNAGLVSETLVTNMQGYGTTLLGNLGTAGYSLVIYSKPKPARGIYPASGGFVTPVVSSHMGNVPTNLRRRRYPAG